MWFVNGYKMPAIFVNEKCRLFQGFLQSEEIYASYAQYVIQSSESWGILWHLQPKAATEPKTTKRERNHNPVKKFH